MPEPSPEQRKQNTIETFNLVAGGYDNPSQRFFPFCADRLVSFLKPLPGQKFLDVGSGTGAVSTAAAQQLGATGRVTAIDLAENMLNRAEQNVRKMALNNVDFHIMDGEALVFRDRYFDVVAGSFCVFFFTDMVTGLKQWLRVLKPGGNAGFTSFAATAFTPLMEMFLEDLAEYGIEVTLERIQKLAREDDCVELMQAAGFIDIESRIEQMGYHLAGSEDWWEIVMNSGLRGFVEQLSEEQQATLRHTHSTRIDERVTDKGLWLDVGTIFTRGQRPKK